MNTLMCEIGFLSLLHLYLSFPAVWHSPLVSRVVLSQWMYNW